MKIELMSDDYAGGIGGAILGAISGFHFFINDIIPPVTGNDAADFAWAAVIKMFGTIILAVIGGIAGMASKDLYKYLKTKINKK